MENKLEKFAVNWSMQTTLTTSSFEQDIDLNAVGNLKEAVGFLIHYMSLQDNGVEYLKSKLAGAEKFVAATK